MLKRIIFLDRDGTIIEDKIFLNDHRQIVYLPNAFEGLKKLSAAGFEFVVITNQSGVPRGLVQEKNIELIHEKISQDLADVGVKILAYYHAPHLPDSNHPLRKPNTGMLDLAHENYGVDFLKSWVIGDRMTDVEVGHRKSCKTIFLTGTENPSDSEFEAPEHICSDLLECAEVILSETVFEA